MNCEVAQERIVAAVYAELPEDETLELDQHLEGCPDCRTEREQVQALQLLTGALPVMEPDANLMARARLRLQEAMDAHPRRWYRRLMESVVRAAVSLQAAPVAALLVLAVGAAAGGWGGYWLAQRAPASPTQAAGAPVSAAAADAQSAAPADAQAATTESAADLSSVANVSAITRRPGTETVDVAYNQLVPRHVTGSLDDPKIRQLLVMASENPASARVRGDSVGLLAAECKRGHSCQPSGIRDALIVALRYDASPIVREKALAGLQPYVAQDRQVRDAVLEALMNDTDPRIRSASISMLAPVEGDTSVRQVLNSVSTSDDNPHIRFVSRQILDQVPEIQ